MRVEARLRAALGPGSAVGQNCWSVANPAAAVRAVEICADAEQGMCPGRPRDGRVGLIAPGGILSLWVDDFVARVGAGMTLAELDRGLRDFDLCLGVEVASPESTTLGSVFARADHALSGPRGLNLRDRVLGVSAVDGRGRLLASGGRVVKNVAGYDFGRLHWGARGSLGLLLDLTLRLVARPERSGAIWWPCSSGSAAEVLVRSRAEWGGDSRAELVVGGAVADRAGLPGPGIVFRFSGSERDWDARCAANRVTDVSASWGRLLEIAGERHAARVDPFGEEGVDLAEVGTSLGYSTTPSVLPLLPRAEAVKRVFDPGGLWPGLPGVARGER